MGVKTRDARRTCTHLNKDTMSLAEGNHRVNTQLGAGLFFRSRFLLLFIDMGEYLHVIFGLSLGGSLLVLLVLLRNWGGFGQLLCVLFRYRCCLGFALFALRHYELHTSTRRTLRSFLDPAAGASEALKKSSAFGSWVKFVSTRSYSQVRKRK